MDNKGAIAAATYAMKSVVDQRLALTGKVELLIYLAEKSDHIPLKDFLSNNDIAPINLGA